MSDAPSIPATTLAPFAEQHAVCRLLVPVKRPDGARPAIAYAIRRRAAGQRVALALLHVEAVPAPWSDDDREIRTLGQPASAEVFVDAMRVLESRDIEYATHVRSGPVVFSILDAAEELDCREIVVPAPGRPLARLWSRRVVTALLAEQRSIAVVTVSKRGTRQFELSATTPV